MFLSNGRYITGSDHTIFPIVQTVWISGTALLIKHLMVKCPLMSLQWTRAMDIAHHLFTEGHVVLVNVQSAPSRYLVYSEGPWIIKAAMANIQHSVLECRVGLLTRPAQTCLSLTLQTRTHAHTGMTQHHWAVYFRLSDFWEFFERIISSQSTEMIHLWEQW